MSPRVVDLLAVAARPLLFLIYWLSGFLPRDPCLWAFGSWSGRRYADNAAALFEHVSAQSNGPVRAVWITREPEIRADLRAAGLQAHLAYSPRGLWACARAGVYLYDGLTKDVQHWLSRGARRALLRHGVGIKRIERAIDMPNHRLYQLFRGTVIQRIGWGWLIPWHLVRPDFAIATSPAHVRQGADCYGIPQERFAITGFPRNDQLLVRAQTGAATGDSDLAWIQAQKAAGHPVFLYMPTFRDDQRHFDFAWRQLNALSGRLGIRLLAKLHYVDAERGFSRADGSLDNLHLADAYRDANRLYGQVDGLISDYSSASYDFMLTGKPLVFFIPDQEQYRVFSRSLYYDFDRVTPGPKARSLAELEQSLATISVNGLGEWKDHYAEVLDLFHSHRDGHACERVYQEVAKRFLPKPVYDSLQHSTGAPKTCEY